MLTSFRQHKLKFEKWWVYKIGSGVFAWLLFRYMLTNNCGVVHTSYQVVCLLLLMVGLAIQGHLFNDLGDTEIDQRAGKINIFDGVRIEYRIWIISGIVLMNIILSFLYFSALIRTLVVIQIILNAVYALHPFRCKERGWAALIISAIQERTLPYYIIISYTIQAEQHLHFVLLFLVWGFLWECRNYIKGQIADEQNDKATSVKSLAIRYGARTLHHWMKIILATEVFFLATWLFVFSMSYASSVFLIFLTSITLLYLSINRISHFHQLTEWVDYHNNFALLNAGVCALFTLHPQQNFWLLALLLLFPNKTLLAVVVTAILHAKTAIVRLYYLIRKPLSLLVNYSIYYFRLYILRWTETKSRGEKE